MRTIQRYELQNESDQTIAVTGLKIGDALVGIKNQVLGIDTEEPYLIVLADTEQETKEWTIKIRTAYEDCDDVQAMDCIGVFKLFGESCAMFISK